MDVNARGAVAGAVGEFPVGLLSGSTARAGKSGKGCLRAGSSPTARFFVAMRSSFVGVHVSELQVVVMACGGGGVCVGGRR